MNQNESDEGMDITVHTGDNESTSYHRAETIVYMKATLIVLKTVKQQQSEASLFDDTVNVLVLG